MASEVKTNKVSPATGTDVTLGDASDTFTVPSGSAIVIASGGDINVQSSGEIDIASGATLDVNGTIDLTGATKTGFPAGGLSYTQQWRLHTTFTGTTATISTNLEAIDLPLGFGIIGSAMTESSGIFTFPATGIWLVKGHFYYWQNGNGGSYYGTGHLWTTTDDGTYAEAAQCRTSDYYSSYGSMTVDYLFNVADISNCKCKFAITQGNSAGQIIGDTAVNKTYFTFTKLGDA